ncbi:hypothetical protein ACJJIU_08400 [Microbulbifer sp. CnH-101-E]|uniref:hypothetical protein n=1 Tax=unclassified Microbulbifer TaxID=2619833 RepID=UPI0040398FE3
MKISSIHKMETNLKKISCPNYTIVQDNSGILCDVDQEVMRCQYDVLNLILKILHFNSSQKHVASIHSYRYIHMSRFMRAPPPCPICMAISLWFFNLASWEYGPHHYIQESNYPFLGCLGYKEFYKPNRFIYISNHFKFYKVSNAFTMWSYKRSLELSFIDIYLFVLYLLGRHKKKDYDRHLCYRYDIYHRKIIEGSYFLDVDKNKASVYYENESPLQILKSYLPEISLKECDKYKCYLQFCMDDGAKFSFDLQDGRLSFRKFLNLHEQFKQFVQLPPPEYSPGSSPFVR